MRDGTFGRLRNGHCVKNRKRKKPRSIMLQGFEVGNPGSVGAAQVEPQVVVSVRAAVIGQMGQLIAVRCDGSLHASALLALAGRRWKW